MNTRGHHGLLFDVGAAPPASPNFMATLYTGDGTTAKSIPGVDLSGGGIAWIKRRDGSSERHYFIYSTNGSSPQLLDTASAAAGGAAAATFDANGVNLTSAAGNVNGAKYVCWFFKKAPGFLDIVAFTGNAAARTIAHSLGVDVGAVMIKRPGASSDWVMYHRALGPTIFLYPGAGLANQAANATYWNSTAPTTSVFSLGTNALVNSNGNAMVAFVFAHDTAGDIQCVGYTGAGGTSNQAIGWQPKMAWLIPNAVVDRMIVDQARTPGFTGNDAKLYPNLNIVESAATDVIQLISGGFSVSGDFNTSARTYATILVK